MSKELNNFTHCSKLDLIKMYKKSRRDMRRLSRQKVDLEKENAELKYELEEIKKRILPQDMCELMAEVKENYENKVKAEQRTQAIGIIKRWYETNRSACIEPSQELIEVTEQFLEEIEK